MPAPTATPGCSPVCAHVLSLQLVVSKLGCLGSDAGATAGLDFTKAGILGGVE